MGIVVDTSAFVDLQRRGDELSASISDGPMDVYVPTLVLAELWVGVELAPSAKAKELRARQVDALIDGTVVLPFSEEIARTYSRLYVELRRRGTLIPANDLAIAATATHAGHEILVGMNDEVHFRAVPGLIVRTL